MSRLFVTSVVCCLCLLRESRYCCSPFALHSNIYSFFSCAIGPSRVESDPIGSIIFISSIETDRSTALALAMASIHFTLAPALARTANVKEPPQPTTPRAATNNNNCSRRGCQERIHVPEGGRGPRFGWEIGDSIYIAFVLQKAVRLAKRERIDG